MSDHLKVSRSILLEGGGHGDWWHHSHMAPLLRLIAFMDGSSRKSLIIFLITKLLSHLLHFSEEVVKIIYNNFSSAYHVFPMIKVKCRDYTHQSLDMTLKILVTYLQLSCEPPWNIVIIIYGFNRTFALITTKTKRK